MTDLLGGRYELLELWGIGGAADVYRGRDHLLSRTVAVKLHRARKANESAARTTETARMLRTLDHPTIVKLWDFGTDNTGVFAGCPYAVMEFIPGPTLAADIGRGPMDALRAGVICAALADALRYLHSQGVLHCDIKPANVILEPDLFWPAQSHARATTRLVDFDAARYICESSVLTESAMVVGTLAYLSPEEVAGATASPASDIYSLGLVLVECLTGTKAYPCPSVECARDRLHRSPVLPAELEPALRDMLGAMIDRRPESRPTPVDVISTLQRIELAGPMRQPLPVARMVTGAT